MRTELLRLGSVVKYGVEGSKSAAINLIYTFLLQEFGLNFYNYIKINQIGQDLDELILRTGPKSIHINIRYPAEETFDSKTAEERNSIRLDIIHSALLRLAGTDRRIEVSKLEAIKGIILGKKFNFCIDYRSFINKRNKCLIGKVVVHPEEDRFTFYAVIEENNVEKCRVLLFVGLPTDYFDEFFFYGKWRGLNEYIISGKRKEVEFHVFIDQCTVRNINLTAYTNPPLFEMMKADISSEQKEKAYQDWLHSLPPNVAAFMDKPN